MSGWTVLSLEPVKNSEYEHSKYDDGGNSSAMNDLCATVDEDDAVRAWTYGRGTVYVYLNAPRYAFRRALDWLERYREIVNRAVVLGANDTSDTGTAKLAKRDDTGHFWYTDEYEEIPDRDGYWVGHKACAVMFQRHGIFARDPFHDRATDAWWDEKALDRGTNRL